MHLFGQLLRSRWPDRGFSAFRAEFSWTCRVSNIVGDRGFLQWSSVWSKVFGEADQESARLQYGN